MNDQQGQMFFAVQTKSVTSDLENQLSQRYPSNEIHHNKLVKKAVVIRDGIPSIKGYQVTPPPRPMYKAHVSSVEERSEKNTLAERTSVSPLKGA